MKFKILLIVIIIKTSLFSLDTVIYPKPMLDDDTRYDFQITILKASLDITVKQYGAYTLQASEKRLPEVRHVRELLTGENINIIREITSNSLEEILIPIRIPIQKGILGYRIFLIDKANKKIFDSIDSLDELKKFCVGQGRGWGDVKILRYNEFNVIESHNYNGLFYMLENDRFDLFPRGITEAPIEYSSRIYTNPDIVIDENSCLYYPLVEYFFFNKKDSRLAERIEEGMKLLISTGEYDNIFNNEFSERILQANLKSRHIYKLENPFIPNSTPLGHDQYWFKIDDF